MGLPVLACRATRAALTAALFAAGVAGGNAQPGDDGSIMVELNGLQPSEAGCRTTFVVTNGLGAGIDRAAYEIVFFDAGGLVERLAVVDFLGLADGRTRVRQFAFDGMDCTDISRILVNDAAECAGGGVGPDDCMRRLTVENRTAIRFGP